MKCETTVSARYLGLRALTRNAHTHTHTHTHDQLKTGYDLKERAILGDIEQLLQREGAEEEKDVKENEATAGTAASVQRVQTTYKTLALKTVGQAVPAEVKEASRGAEDTMSKKGMQSAEEKNGIAAPLGGIPERASVHAAVDRLTQEDGEVIEMKKEERKRAAEERKWVDDEEKREAAKVLQAVHAFNVLPA